VHKCSIYDNKKRWRLAENDRDGAEPAVQEHWKGLTGQREMDADGDSGLLRALEEVLERQNAGQSGGW